MIAQIVNDSTVSIDGRFFPAIQPSDEEADGIPGVCWSHPMENDAQIDIYVEAGTATVTLLVDGREATVMDGHVQGLDLSVIADDMERLAVVVLGCYRTVWDDVDALLEELAYLSALPVKHAEVRS